MRLSRRQNNLFSNVPPRSEACPMARKVLNRKELREQAESAEGAKKKKTAKKAPKKRATKKAKEVRMKLFWGVFNQSLKRIALFEFSQKKQAEQKASALSTSQKTPHFVQKVKEEITEKP